MEEKKLKVFATVGEVLSGVTRHYFQLLIAAWPAFVLIFAAVGALLSLGSMSEYVALAGKVDAGGEAPKLTPDQIRALFSSANIAAFLVFVFFIMCANVLAAVRWHRFVLLGEGATGASGKVRFLRDEDWVYIWAAIKIMLLVVPVLIIGAVVISAFLKLGGSGAPNGQVSGQIMLVAILAYVLLIFAVWTLAVRTSLALPDAALGRGGRVLFVLHATSGNGFRLFWATLFTVLLTSFIAIIADALVQLCLGIFVKTGERAAGVSVVVSFVIALATYFFNLMAQITVLSVAYREIIGLPSSGGHEEIPQAA